jgi:hypothetical protein
MELGITGVGVGTSITGEAATPTTTTATVINTSGSTAGFVKLVTSL